jgi:hypothetical protein
MSLRNWRACGGILLLFQKLIDLGFAVRVWLDVSRDRV